MAAKLTNFHIFKIKLKIFLSIGWMSLSLIYQTGPKEGIYCGVMKFLADMPPCLGGGDNRTNEV